MISKEKLIEAINQLPNEFSIDDVLEKVILTMKIEKGIEQSDNDQIISDENLEKELPTWLK